MFKCASVKNKSTCGMDTRISDTKQISNFNIDHQTTVLVTLLSGTSSNKKLSKYSFFSGKTFNPKQPQE